MNRNSILYSTSIFRQTLYASIKWNELTAAPYRGEKFSSVLSHHRFLNFSPTRRPKTSTFLINKFLTYHLCVRAYCVTELWIQIWQLSANSISKYTATFHNCCWFIIRSNLCMPMNAAEVKQARLRPSSFLYICSLRRLHTLIWAAQQPILHQFTKSVNKKKNNYCSGCKNNTVMITANNRPPVNYSIFYPTFPLRLTSSWDSNHLILVRLHCAVFSTSSAPLSVNGFSWNTTSALVKKARQNIRTTSRL